MVAGGESRVRAELMLESFDLMNRDNQRVEITDDGFTNTADQFSQGTQRIGAQYFPASHQKPANFMTTTNAYAPRQVQVAIKVIF
jgi:hypothetical protein